MDDSDNSDGDEVSFNATFCPKLILSQNMGLTKIDHELARFCCMLEKKYASDCTGGYAYIDAVTATPIPLTPFMLKQWARAMVSTFHCRIY